MSTKEQTIPKGYKHTEVGVIPSDWEVKSMGDIGEIKMCRRVFNHETKPVGAIPFYKIGTFGKEADAYISQDLYDSYRRRFSFPKKGTILISAAGTIGRTIIYDGKPAYFQDSNIIWIENDETLISNEYLFQTFQVVKYNTEGGTIQRLYNSILSNTKFICPEKPEQTAIATALSDTDALIEKLTKLIEKKKNIKQGAMQELLTGKRRLPGFSGKWEMKPLDQFTSKKEYSIVDGPFGSQMKVHEFVDTGIPVVEMEHLDNLPALGIVSRFITDQKFQEVKRSAIYPDDIIISKTGTLGLLGIVPHNMPRGIITSRLAKISIDKSKAYINFVFHWLRKLKIDGYWEKVSQGGTMQILGVRMLKETPFPDIELEEQTAIATVLSDMDTEIKRLESQLAKYQNVKQGMMQTLLTGKIRLI